MAQLNIEDIEIMHKLIKLPMTIFTTLVAISIFPSIANAMVFTYNPATTTETLENDFFDDDLDVRGSPITPRILNEGDMMTWDYKYKKHYKVESSDMADIDKLTIFGSSTGMNNGRADATVEINLTDKEGNLIGKKYTMTSGWGVNNLTLSADDVLGNLDGLKIGGFSLKLTIGAGSTVNFVQALFNWEIDDIEEIAKVPVSEPSSLILLGISLAGIALSQRKKYNL